jgi:RNA polymerase sigma factor (TIGR02999 family)
MSESVVRPRPSEDRARCEPGTITRLLQEADQGLPGAANRLFVLVETRLRRIARKRRRAAGFGPKVDAPTTALVHDAFLRLVGQGQTTWQPGDCRKFFRYAATKIHDLLIDEIGKQQAQKRGGDRQRVELGADPECPAPGPAGDLDLQLDLRDALDCLEAFAWEEATVFRIYVYLEWTFEETAEVLGLSKTKTQRIYKRAKLWLRRKLKAYAPTADQPAGLSRRNCGCRAS